MSTASAAAAEPLIVSTNHAAQICDCSRSLIYRWFELGLLTPIRIAGITRVSVDELRQLIVAHGGVLPAEGTPVSVDELRQLVADNGGMLDHKPIKRRAAGTA